MPNTPREMTSTTPLMTRPDEAMGSQPAGNPKVPHARSGADAQRCRELAQRRDDRQRDDLAGLRILRWHVLDREREARGISLDLDHVAIARDRRIGPDVDHGAIRPH